MSYLVINVEVPLSLILRYDSGLFQQKVGNLSTIGFSCSTELDLKILPLYDTDEIALDLTVQSS